MRLSALFIRKKYNTLVLVFYRLRYNLVDILLYLKAYYRRPYY
jgi:hypothetical protein